MSERRMFIRWVSWVMPTLSMLPYVRLHRHGIQELKPKLVEDHLRDFRSSMLGSEPSDHMQKLVDDYSFEQDLLELTMLESDYIYVFRNPQGVVIELSKKGDKRKSIIQG